MMDPGVRPPKWPVGDATLILLFRRSEGDMREVDLPGSDYHRAGMTNEFGVISALALLFSLVIIGLDPIIHHTS
ncbi:MAG: hypothetical protein ABJ275_10850 [Maricaulaceae bacterium]